MGSFITLNYDKCVEEFSKNHKTRGKLFLYVNGRFGLFELLKTLRRSMENVRETDANLSENSGVNSVDFIG